MKRSFLGKACLVLFFSLVQLSVTNANNGGTLAAAPAPQQSNFNVPVKALEKLDELVSILSKMQYLPQAKKGVLVTNSTVTNLRPNNEDLDMAWLEIEHTGSQPKDFVFIYPSTIVLPNGQTSSFTMPDFTNISRISLRHLGSSFPCEESGTITTGGTTYTGWSSCVERIEWLDISSVTGGITLVVN